MVPDPKIELYRQGSAAFSERCLIGKDHSVGPVQRRAGDGIASKEVGLMKEHIEGEQATNGVTGENPGRSVCSIFLFNQGNELGLDERQKRWRAPTRLLPIRPPRRRLRLAAPGASPCAT